MFFRRQNKLTLKLKVKQITKKLTIPPTSCYHPTVGLLFLQMLNMPMHSQQMNVQFLESNFI